MTLKGLTRSILVIAMVLFVGASAAIHFRFDSGFFAGALYWNSLMLLLLRDGLIRVEKRLIDLEKKTGLRSSMGWDSD